MIATLTEQYIACCQAYADLLLKLFGLGWGSAQWEDGRKGTSLCFRDEARNESYCLPMSDIAYIIDNDMTRLDVREWVRYNSVTSGLGLFPVGIREWNEGCERVGEQDIEHLVELHQEMERAEASEGDGSPGYGNARRKFSLAREQLLSTISIYGSSINRL